MHIINSDLTAAVLETWRRVEAAQFRRVAIIMRHAMDQSLGHRLSLIWRGILSGNAARFVSEGLRYYDSLPLSDELVDWLRREQPDILVVDGEECFQAVKSILPPVCAVVAIGLRATPDGVAGMYHPAESLAEVALLKLDGMIRTGERGLAADRQTTLVEGKWLPGKSAPSV